jgi:transcriptional regulator with XRE-family HTH domain
MYDDLKRAIIASGLSVAELARACHMSPTALHNWLDGKVIGPRYSNMRKVADFLGYDLEMKRQRPPRATRPGPALSTALWLRQ